MTFLAAQVLDRALIRLGESLPRIGGAIVLMLVGIPLAWLVGRVVRRVLEAVGADSHAERLGVRDVLDRLGLGHSVSRLIGTIVRIALVVVVVVAAVSLLGLGALSIALNEVVLFVPKLIVALALLLAGAVIGDFLGERVQRLADQMALGGPARDLVRTAVLAIFALMALAELGIPTAIVMAMIALVVTGITLTIALAFGLGGRDVAREVAAGRYVGEAFSVGQRISIGEVSGEIVRLDRAAAVLQTAPGRIVRVPHHLLLDSIVELEEGAPAPAEAQGP